MLLLLIHEKVVQMQREQKSLLLSSPWLYHSQVHMSCLCRLSLLCFLPNSNEERIALVTFLLMA